MQGNCLSFDILCPSMSTQSFLNFSPFSKFQNWVARIVLMFSGSAVKIMRWPATVASTVYGFLRSLHIRTKVLLQNLRQSSAETLDRNCTRKDRPVLIVSCSGSRRDLETTEGNCTKREPAPESRCMAPVLSDLGFLTNAASDNSG